MGYSSPKKQLDLTEFLKTPAGKRPGQGYRRKSYGYRAAPEESQSEGKDAAPKADS